MDTQKHERNINALLANDEFVDWVLSPSPPTDKYWSQWQETHPDRKASVEMAKKIILNVYAAEEQLVPVTSIGDDWQNIKLNTIVKEAQDAKKRKWDILKLGSIIAVILAITLYLYMRGDHNDNIMASDNEEWIVQENINGVQQIITLSDSSVAILEPYSTLKYPKEFRGKRRDVILDGEAFFDIERDSLHPFIIYANETITKVLGTSFTIKAFKGEDDVQVIVKSGKVEVFAKVSAEDAGEKVKKMVLHADKETYITVPNRKVEIVPNQKAIFNIKKKQLLKTIAAKPIILAAADRSVSSQKFDNVPVHEVFLSMQHAYGIKINYNKTQLKDCVITTALTDVPMLDKVSMICDVLSLRYTEKEGEIYVTGPGCK